MALEKIEIVDRVEILETGCVQVRTKTVILENGKEISSTFHRHIIAPGDNYTKETNRVKAVCAAVHDASTVSAYKALQVALDESKV
jgi:hypothetical protein